VVNVTVVMIQQAPERVVEVIVIVVVCVLQQVPVVNVDVTCFVVVTVTVWETVVVFFSRLVLARAPWEEAEAEKEMTLISMRQPSTTRGSIWIFLYSSKNHVLVIVRVVTVVT